MGCCCMCPNKSRSIPVSALITDPVTPQLLYTTQSTLAFFAVNHGEGLANNSMTDEQRAALSPDSVEYGLR